MKDISMIEIYKTYFYALSTGGIENILQTTHQILGYPVILNDNAGNTLFQIPACKMGDPDWDYSFENRTIQREHYLNLFKNFISKPELHNRPLDVYEGFLAEQHQVIGVISYRQQILGMVSLIVGETVLSEKELEVIEIFITAIRAELKKVQTYSHRESSHLAIVLTEENCESNQFMLAFSSLRKLYSGNYQFIISKPNSENDVMILDVLGKDLNNNCPNCINCILDEQLVTLLHRNVANTDFAERALDIIETYPVVNSISTVFADLKDIRDYYYQTQMTLRTGLTLKPNSKTHWFGDFAPYQIIAAASEHGPIDVFLDPLIKEMRDYDEKNCTEYLQTLNAYLYCKQSKTETIKKLFIHSNTLTYRLKRMEELFHISFEDGVRLNNLYGSLMMISFMNGSAPELDI